MVFLCDTNGESGLSRAAAAAVSPEGGSIALRFFRQPGPPAAADWYPSPLSPTALYLYTPYSYSRAIPFVVFIIFKYVKDIFFCKFKVWGFGVGFCVWLCFFLALEVDFFLHFCCSAGILLLIQYLKQ